jgi:hypothetical protein
MEGLPRDRRLAVVQRLYAPTRLSDAVLTDAYDRVVQARPLTDVAEVRSLDPSASSESSLLVLTGGRYA